MYSTSLSICTPLVLHNWLYKSCPLCISLCMHACSVHNQPIPFTYMFFLIYIFLHYPSTTCRAVDLHTEKGNIIDMTHGIPVDSSAARMPFPGATILRAMSCSSFFCSGVSAGYWWVMVAERERGEKEPWRGHFASRYVDLDDCPALAPVFFVPLLSESWLPRRCAKLVSARDGGWGKLPKLLQDDS